jgi:hypothetical protein
MAGKRIFFDAFSTPIPETASASVGSLVIIQPPDEQLLPMENQWKTSGKTDQ